MKTVSCVISHLKTCFAILGIADTVIADNIPFGSNEFAKFAEEWGFKVKTSSPHHALSNGQSEIIWNNKAIFLRKAADDGRDMPLDLLAYRNTPISGLE